MTRPVAPAVGLVVCLAVLACGPAGSEPDAASDVRSAATATSTDVDDAQDGDDGTVLAGQFSVFVGGIGGDEGPVCSDGVDELPDVHLLGTDRLAIGRTVVVCFLGFDFAEPVALAVAWPGGSRTIEVVFGGEWSEVDLRDTPGPLSGWVEPPDDHGSLLVWVPPGTPNGRWQLTATQGDRAAETFAQASTGTTPVMARVEGPDEDTLRFRISGFPPGETPVGLYHLPERTPEPGSSLLPDWVTATLDREIATVVADADGAGVLDVDVAGIGPGRWCITAAVLADAGRCAARLGPN